MKTHFIFLCLIVSGGLASASTQTTANQDKPSRLYVKNYIENNNSVVVSSYSGGIIGKDIMSVNDNVNWTNGSPGSFSWAWQWNRQLINYGIYFTNKDNVTLSWSQIGWPAVLGVQTTWSETTSSFTNTSTKGYAPIFLEHCDTSVPIVDISGTYYYSGTVQITKCSGSRTAQAIMKLQTGGKATSKLRNLFALTASATRIIPEHYDLDWGVGYYDWTSEMPQDYYDFAVSGYNPTSTDISAQNIAIGSYGNLSTSGVLYKSLPDNADVDVTPYVAGVDYYTFNLNPPVKYHSYFDLYVQQANPGFSLSISNPTNNVGHASWRFRTDAPSDALQYISTDLRSFLNTPWGFYPSGGLFTVPGQLQNDSGHSANISRTFYIGFSDLINGLEYTKGISNAPPVYVLTAFNCVGAARCAGFEADIFGLPEDESPQNFGVTLIEMYPAPSQIIGPFIDISDVFYSSAPY